MNNLLLKKLSRLLFTAIIFGIFLSVKAESPNSGDWDKVVNLEGRWKFAIGDYAEWSSEYFNDSEWEEIYVPSNWEDQGFPDYDGYAWYRITFKIDPIYRDEDLYLMLGYIDDIDAAYINGTLIGFSGVFPPNQTTAYNANRRYNIPSEVLNFDKPNTIAVRVYDTHLAGGIVNGDIGIFRNLDLVHPEIQLAGSWKFKIGDNIEWKNPEYDHSDWENIMVPGFWMHYGYYDYDGFAWYRKEFLFKENSNSKYVLVVGKIDDIDQVYLNGKLVGATGDMDELKIYGNEYSQFRVYYLKDDDLIRNSKNLVAVRVLDVKQHGGIYEGPVGIMKLKTFQEFWKQKDKPEKKRKWIFDFLFN